ncbi:DUF7668 domain-containing protein [Actinomadura flavalba]|uniref:DUF7668 domain-containing protein n=1 Tax=Actinomadura flavalba TaxID=1120938 RepID=UPI00037009FC|nr:hypothetical protein [Actinomadura flavalba]
MLPDDALGVLRTVVALLVHGEYAEIEALTEGRRLFAEEIEAAVGGRELTEPPESAFEGAEGTELETGGEYERGLHVAFPLWTAAGRSDLVAEFTLLEVMERVWTVELVSLREAPAAP